MLDLGDNVFAPCIRTSVAMIRLPSKAALFKFLGAWKRADKAISKAHGKFWQLSSHFKSLAHNNIEIGWKNCSVWFDDFEAVKWDIHTNSASWMALVMSKHDLVIDVAAANVAMNSARSSLLNGTLTRAFRFYPSFFF